MIPKEPKTAVHEELSVFADESADETQSRVFAIAGVVGSEPDWRAAEDRWVERTGGEIFHAADCEHEGKLDLYRDLTQVLATSRLAARAVSLDLVALREYFPAADAEFGYYKCYTMVISWLVENVAAPLNRPLRFTFDRRPAIAHNAQQLYRLATHEIYKDRNLLAEDVTFSSRDNTRIQMADLVARESMKDLDNQIGPTPRKRRKSLLALSGGHVSFAVIGRDFCAGWRAAVDRLESEQSIGAKYENWLATNKIADNWSNRIRFAALVGSADNRNP
jgi:hypothetical protein